MNNKYTWNFDTCGPAGRGTGTVNPSSKHFKNQSKIQALVREALQNSLDAARVRYDKDNPVKVTFEFKTIDNVNVVLPNFSSELRKHINGCHEMYPRNKQYRDMLDYANKHRNSIPVLYITDENTKGMFYEKDNPNCTFYGYLKADGAHVDQGNGEGGGSNGIGKMASFNYSKLSTVLVSSHNANEGQRIFQGATILCSHYANDATGKRQLYYGGGFYDCNGGEAVIGNEIIPKDFHREKPGTDIIIVGVDDCETEVQKAYEDIKRNVMLNFWPAINSGTLVVQVGDVIINSGSLEQLMKDTFHETIDTEYLYYKNPLPYYLAVKGAMDGDENCRMYGDNDEELGLKEHPTLGHVHFFIMRNKNSKDKIIATRKPLMVIQPFNKRSAYGYSAVVFCDDENGNKYLSNAEGPAHNKWDVNGMDDDSGLTKEDYYNSKKAIEELETYINECVLNFFASDISEECNIVGLPDLLASYGDKPAKSGSMTTKIKNKLKNSTTVKSKPIDHIIENGGDMSDDEEDTDLLGGDNKNGGENDPDFIKKKPSDDDNKDDDNKDDDNKDDDNKNDDNKNDDNKVDEDDKKKTPTTTTDSKAIDGTEVNVRKLINCNLRVMSMLRDGNKVCRTKFKLDNDIERAAVSVYLVTADRKKNSEANIKSLIWAEVNGEEAEVKKNEIINISLHKGDNEIFFRFANNNTYRLTIELYSIKK